MAAPVSRSTGAPGAPGPLARALGSELARGGMRLLLGRDDRLGRLAGEYELSAVHWGDTEIRLVTVFRPPQVDDQAVAETRRRIAALLAWGEHTLDLRNGGRCDILLVATRPLPDLHGATTQFGDVRVCVSWADAGTGRAAHVIGEAEGVPNTAMLRRVAERVRAEGAPSFTTMLETETEVHLALKEAARGGAHSRESRPVRPNSARARADPDLPTSPALARSGGGTRLGETVVPSLISLVVSLLVVSNLSGWRVALGVVGLIAVHEGGHMVMATAFHKNVSAPMFLGPFGGFVRHDASDTPQQHAAIALAGPGFGVAASLLLILAGIAMGDSSLSALLITIGHWGCIVNLINLVPFGIVDGHAVLPGTHGITLWMVALTAAVLAIYAFVANDPLMVVAAPAATALLAAFLTLRLQRTAWQRAVASSWAYNLAVLAVVGGALIGNVVAA